MFVIKIYHRTVSSYYRQKDGRNYIFILIIFCAMWQTMAEDDEDEAKWNVVKLDETRMINGDVNFFTPVNFIKALKTTQNFCTLCIIFSNFFTIYRGKRCSFEDKKQFQIIIIIRIFFLFWRAADWNNFPCEFLFLNNFKTSTENKFYFSR